jgi:cell wall-associated NlpC family hydrolase
VFQHFNIEVPRSSSGFTDEGSPVALNDAMPGDLILFTGTNSQIRTVGHIGLVVSNDTSGIHFIHSSSGKENSVIITQLDERYMARFVKVIRIRK